MSLFKLEKNNIRKLIANSVDLEKKLQTIFENNLSEILNIDFLAHEYSTSFGGRIDTLGIDKNGSPCIIEYKRNQNNNVINQGLSYLNWLLDHKADFSILCKKNNINVDIDWDSPRVICIAESYNKFDLDMVNILPIKIELLRYCIYDENILLVESENHQKLKISTSNIIKKSKLEEKDNILQKIYTIEDHLNGFDKKIIDLFQSLREKILSLDENIIEDPKAKYVAYKTSTNFTDIHLQQSCVKIYVNVKSGQLKDPDNIARDLTKPKMIGHWGNGDYEIKLENDSQIDIVFNLIKQSFDLNK